MNYPDLPGLLYSFSSDPDNTYQALLTAPVTCIGRLGRGECEPPDADLVQISDLPTVSLKHARIRQTDAGYLLENWQGRYGVGVYERDLAPGEAHLLSHCDIFRLPNLEEHIRFQFFVAQSKTQLHPFQIERNRGKLYVFGATVRLTPNEYRLIAHLDKQRGELCSYAELIAAVWQHDPQPFERKGDLEVLLSEVRRKLRAASGGVTFLQTVRGQGIRLAV